MANSEEKGLVLFVSASELVEIPADAVFPMPTGLPGVTGGVYYKGSEIAKDVKRALAAKIRAHINDRWDAAMKAAAREASPIKKG